MLTIQYDFAEFEKTLEELIKKHEELPEKITREWPRKSWNKVQNKIRKMAIDNLELAYEVPINERAKREKEKQLELGTKLVRTKSGQEFPVISSDLNWYRTGFMESKLIEKLESIPSYELLGGEENVEFGIDIDVEEFINDYPLNVDMELMKRSGGKVGLIILQDEQAREILDLIIKDNITSFEEYFGDNE